MFENECWLRSFYAAITGLSSRSDLDASDISARASEIADEAAEIIDNRETERYGREYKAGIAAGRKQLEEELAAKAGAAEKD